MHNSWFTKEYGLEKRRHASLDLSHSIFRVRVWKQGGFFPVAFYIFSVFTIFGEDGTRFARFEKAAVFMQMHGEIWKASKSEEFLVISVGSWKLSEAIKAKIFVLCHLHQTIRFFIRFDNLHEIFKSGHLGQIK